MNPVYDWNHDKYGLIPLKIDTNFRAKTNLFDNLVNIFLKKLFQAQIDFVKN